MNKWMEAKVKYTKINEKGKEQKVTETYLFDALSFTEAETRVIDELTTFIQGEFKVIGLKPSKLADVHLFNTNADRFFKCRLVMIVYSVESGKESKSNSDILIQANSIEEACLGVIDFMKGSVTDYDYPAIGLSPILEVFPYSSSNTGDNSEEHH